MLIGNLPIQAYLQKSAKSGIFPHAQLWNGPAHVGKTTFLEYYFDLLHIDRKLAVQWYPASDLDMETARSLIKQTTETSLWSGPRFVVITQAEQLRYQVCNALLKVLEEPRSRVTLLLLTSYADHIPATVRSRCSPVWFQRVPTDQLIAAFPTQVECISLAHGLPGVVISWQKGTAAQKWLKQITHWIAVLQQPPAERLTAVADQSSDDLLTSLNSLETALYSVLTMQTTGAHYPASFQAAVQQLAVQHQLADTVQALADLAQVRRSAAHPVQPKLVMTNLLLNIYTPL